MWVKTEKRRGKRSALSWTTPDIFAWVSTAGLLLSSQHGPCAMHSHRALTTKTQGGEYFPINRNQFLQRYQESNWAVSNQPSNRIPSHSGKYIGDFVRDFCWTVFYYIEKCFLDLDAKNILSEYWSQPLTTVWKTPAAYCRFETNNSSFKAGKDADYCRAIVINCNRLFNKLATQSITKAGCFHYICCLFSLMTEWLNVTNRHF